MPVANQPVIELSNGVISAQGLGALSPSTGYMPVVIQKARVKRKGLILPDLSFWSEEVERFHIAVVSKLNKMSPRVRLEEEIFSSTDSDDIFGFIIEKTPFSVKKAISIGVYSFSYKFDEHEAKPLAGNIGSIPSCESVFDPTPFGVCRIDEPLVFEAPKKFALKKEAYITTFVFSEVAQEEYNVESIIRVPDGFGDINPRDPRYYVRVSGDRFGFRSFIAPVDSTIIQVFTKLKPEVFSPPRILTDFLSEMEQLVLNMLDYELQESPYLYSAESPYIHVGTKMNRVIYPTSAISIKGKRGRYGSY